MRGSADRRLASIQSHLQAPPSAAMAVYRSPVTSHVLDTSRGRPAAGMRVVLEALDADSGQWRSVGEGVTNDDGRVAAPLVPPNAPFRAGTYRVVFATREYFAAIGVTEFFYPSVEIAFVVRRPDEHFHVPLLINPFGYSTYRGSLF
ncbi:hypothetical protein PybrP1_012012 [[Pythium] brassicae (nom. inval.)]|nr:hypothetical protein PybrP1_012012 [[Pythium] brassicae (nom. inval.)]